MKFYNNHKKHNNLTIRYNCNFKNTQKLDEVYYVFKNSVFIFNKIRRLLIARTKRILKKKKITRVVWFKLGKIVSFFKKGLNLRMGKGDGSFFTVRRHYESGSSVIWFNTLRSGFKKWIYNYVKRKLIFSVIVFIKKFYLHLKYFKKNFRKKKKYFFKKSIRTCREYHHSFTLRKYTLWLLTYRFYRRYKTKQLHVSRRFKKTLRYRFLKRFNGRPKFRHMNFTMFLKKFYYNRLFIA